MEVLIDSSSIFTVPFIPGTEDIGNLQPCEGERETVIKFQAGML